jgi:hypothetical protein
MIGVKEEITKREAARREINSAIRMYFSGEDALSIHALAAGAMQLLQDLGKKQGKNLGIELGMQYIYEDRRAEMRAIMRKPQNFVKHSDRPGQENEVLDFRPAALEQFLVIAATSYNELTGQDTPETRTFITWATLRSPSLLMPSEHRVLAEYIQANNGAPSEADMPHYLGYIKQIREAKTMAGIDFS